MNLEAVGTGVALAELRELEATGGVARQPSVDVAFGIGRH